MHDKIKQILISYLKGKIECIRIFQESEIDVFSFDIMTVTDRLTGFMIKYDVSDFNEFAKRTEYYDKFFDENYLVVSLDDMQSYEKFLPRHWGIVCVDEDNVKVFRTASYNINVSRRCQLSILHKSELESLSVENNLNNYVVDNSEYIKDRLCNMVDESLLRYQIAYKLLQRSSASIPDVIEKQVENKVKYKDIEVSLGVPWISKEIVNKFVNYILFNINIVRYNFVEYEPVTGTWHINNKNNYLNSNICAKYGTSRMNALHIIEASLNLREIRIADKGKLNEEETIAALEKQKLITNEFKKWIWEDEYRQKEIENAYNKMFSGYEETIYDGSSLIFPGMCKSYQLYDYQKDAVQRIISTPNTLLAYDVGAGKTFIMIASAMKMREMGISRKNMFVVPNNIIGQWEAAFVTLYPDAKVLTVDPGIFNPKNRHNVLEQMKDGEYDGIIIGYSCFELIPLSAEYLIENMQENIFEIQNIIEKLNNTPDSWGQAALEKDTSYIRKLTDMLIKRDKDAFSDITFEKLGINTLFVDEAHNFKNVPIRTKLKNLRGINPDGSVKCLEMMEKVRCVQNYNGGRGVVFATGTPLCNSISDAYTMQMYLQYDELCKCNLEKFDNWVKTFALLEQVCEVDVTGKSFRFVKRFTKFFNLPELSVMFGRISAFYFIDKLDGIPEKAEHMNSVIHKCDELKLYMDKICDRTEKIRNGQVGRNDDNMLKVCTDGRKASLDLNLVKREQPYDEHSKLVKCAENVYSVYKDYSGCSQLIFCDTSVPKDGEFNVYTKVKDLLIERGVCENEIAFIHSYNTEVSRLKLYDSVNKGIIRILIGSTFKLGIGANVQTKLKAIHHLDVPWRPADMTQREGRILRKGNENNDVLIFRYVTEGCFDSYSWQILERKQRFVSQFLSGNTDTRAIEDLENDVLSYAEVKAIALEMPIMKLISEKENEIKTLQILCNKYHDDKRKLECRIKMLEVELYDAEIRYESTLRNKYYTNRIPNHMYSKVNEESKDVLTAELLSGCNSGDLFLNVLNFEVIFDCIDKKGKKYIYLRRLDVDYRLEMGDSSYGNIRRITNFIKHFYKTEESEFKNIKRLQMEHEEAETAFALPNKYHDELLRCREEYKELLRIAENNNIIVNES